MNPNRRYKKKIYSLCKRVSNGDKRAESELADELEKSSTAVWATKHWLKLHRKKPAVKKQQHLVQQHTRLRRAGSHLMATPSSHIQAVCQDWENGDTQYS